MQFRFPRLSVIVLAVATALALPPAFAQSATTGAATTDSAGAPVQDGKPSSDPVGTPNTTTDSQPAPSTMAGPATFKDLDANKDGKLSKDEVANNSMWAADFDAADANKDGYLSKSEFKKHESDAKKTTMNDSKQH